MHFLPSTLRFLTLASLLLSVPISGQQDFNNNDDGQNFANVHDQDLAVDGAPTPSYLVFDPPSLQLNDYAVGGLVKVRLSAPPRQATTIYYEAPSLSFTACSVQFDQNNWNQWQEVRSVALPYMTEADAQREFKMKFTASCPGNRLHGQVMDYAVTRGAGKSATCTSSGDPHYNTFDGRHYDFMGIGCFQLVNAGYLTIQTITTQWGDTAASVNKAIAIRYGRAVYIIDAVKGKSCDDGGQDTSGIKLIESQNGRDFHFQFPEGTEVKVTIQDGNPKYVDLTVIAAGHLLGRTKGLCGTYDGKQDTDFVGPNDERFPDANQFGQAWKCPERDNLFQCGAKCAGAQDYLMQPCNQCKTPQGLAGSGVVRDIPTGYRRTAPAQWPAYEPIPMPTVQHLPPAPVCPPAFIRDAQIKCRQVFQMPGVTNLVRVQTFIDNCVRDAQLTCSLAFLDGLKSTCMSQVRAVTKSMAYDVQNEGKVRAGKSLSRIYGLGNEGCPQNCSNRGQCLTSGCKCTLGYSGMACEIDLGQAFNGARRFASMPMNNNTGRQFNNPNNGFNDNGDEDFDGNNNNFNNNGFNNNNRFNNNNFNNNGFNNNGFNNNNRFNNNNFNNNGFNNNRFNNNGFNNNNFNNNGSDGDDMGQ